MQLYITRHGQIRSEGTDYIDGVDFPAGDPGISLLGRKQAELLGIRLKDAGFKGQIYSSPYYRAMETSQIIADITGAIIVPSAEIREIVKSKESMIRFKGMDMQQLIKYFSSTCKETELSYPWWKQEEENDEEVYQRVVPLICRIIEKGTDALIVGHGASVEAAESYLMKQYGYAYDIPATAWNCHLTALQIKPKFNVIFKRDISHIPQEMVSSNGRMLSNEKLSGQGQ